MKIDRSELDKSQLESVLQSDTYFNALQQMIESLQEIAKISKNEKTIETRFDIDLGIIINSLFGNLGYSYSPNKEESVETVRAISKGRADTTTRNVVIEFKHPSKLSSVTDKEKAILQTKSYLEGFKKEGKEKTIGLTTDGVQGAMFSIDSFGNYYNEPFTKLNVDMLDKIVQAILGLSQKDLTPDNLVLDFAEDENSPSKKLAINLFDTLKFRSTEKTLMLLTEWKHLFKLSHDDTSQQQAIIQRRSVLSDLFKTNLETIEDEYKALFALQTAYTILIKLVAFKVISQVKYDDSLVDFEEMINLNNQALQLQLDELESGSIIRDYGIQNLLEGDFFSWYSTKEQWESEFSENIREIIVKLSTYRISFDIDPTFRTFDFFKKLYYAVMPREVRHSLGEFYTPHWLANHVIERSIKKSENNGNWRALDPTCGSGTFLTILIEKVVKECLERKLEKADIVREVTQRVIGFDLNPLAVLTARVNYFLNISKLISFDSQIEIPVYAGDAAYTPEKETIDGISFIKYSFETNIAPFPVYFPELALRNLKKFSKTMIEIELDIKSMNVDSIFERLIQLVPFDERETEVIRKKLYELSTKFVEFESKKWNGIWARIITNYLTTINIGRFDIIVGNPPWVDWKNLPSLYREKIKGLKITETIFSGDSFTGGINLNIAALITNVVITNWLAEDGVVGMLMPDTFMVQKTYEGFRNLKLGDGTKAYFSSIDDWKKSGNPFHPVTQKFYTYYITKEFQNYSEGIPVYRYIKKSRENSRQEKLSFEETFNVEKSRALQLNENSTNFTFLMNDKLDIGLYKMVAAEGSEYKGREGIEFYPQEMLIFENVENGFEDSNRITVRNIQVNKSKFKLPQRNRFFEKEYLFPLIRGRDVKAFHATSHYMVPFVYDQSYSEQIAIKETRLRSEAPKIYDYFHSVKSIFESQSGYSKNLINGEEIPFYSLARVGPYSFAPISVVYRDNTSNVAAVVENITMPWGEEKMAVFQNHAVTISQRPCGKFINRDEAYYIAGIINATVVNSFIEMSSDARSFPINPRYQIPLYGNPKIVNYQKKISDISKLAHSKYSDYELIDQLKIEISSIYIEMLKSLKEEL